jgi:hypothetical protein
VRIPPSLRGSVDFFSFRKVFSRSLGVGHVGISMGTTLHSSFSENHLWVKLGLHGFGGGIFGFVLGLHTHNKS